LQNRYTQSRCVGVAHHSEHQCVRGRLHGGMGWAAQRTLEKPHPRERARCGGATLVLHDKRGVPPPAPTSSSDQSPQLGKGPPPLLTAPKPPPPPGTFFLF